MSSEMITTKVLKELAAAGSIRSVVLVGVPGGVAIRAQYGMIERTLQTDLGHVRVFRTVDAAAKFVRHSLKIARAELDLANWNPDQRAA